MEISGEQSERDTVRSVQIRAGALYICTSEREENGEIHLFFFLFVFSGVLHFLAQIFDPELC